MRKTILASFVAFLTLSSHASAQTVLDDSFPLDAGVAIDQMHSAVSGDFLDPTSAQYKGLVLRNKGYKLAICGLVNAKKPTGGTRPSILLPIQSSATRRKSEKTTTMKYSGS